MSAGLLVYEDPLARKNNNIQSVDLGQTTKINLAVCHVRKDGFLTRTLKSSKPTEHVATLVPKLPVDDTKSFAYR